MESAEDLVLELLRVFEAGIGGDPQRLEVVARCDQEADVVFDCEPVQQASQRADEGFEPLCRVSDRQNDRLHLRSRRFIALEQPRDRLMDQVHWQAVAGKLLWRTFDPRRRLGAKDGPHIEGVR